MSEVQIRLPKGVKPPDHVAIILDGNRRWARARSLSDLEGHKAGYSAGRKIADASRNLGVHTFTVWGFSTENWERSPQEIRNIMNLVKFFVEDFKKNATKDGIRFIHLGRKDKLPKEVLKLLAELENETRNNKKHVFNLALDYGGRDEILRAVRGIIKDKIPAEKVDEKLFESYLDTKDQPYPYPDLLIRTSGEQRTSGILPWQLAYTEIYWETKHLPDFKPKDFKKAILEFNRRRRRFGGNDVVKHLTFNPEVVARLELAWWRLKNVPEGTRLRDYGLQHLKEQYGLSKTLAKEAAGLMIDAFLEENNGRNWKKAKEKLGKFYKLIKDEIKMAFEPSIVASLEVQLIKETEDKDDIRLAGEAEDTARELYAEVYRISLLQAAKAARLRVMANIERNLAEKGLGEEHWDKAQDYLERFYRALNERVA